MMRKAANVAKIALMGIGVLAILGWTASYLFVRSAVPDIKISYTESRAPDGSAKVVFVTHRDTNIPQRVCHVSVYVGGGEASREAIVKAGRVALRGDCAVFDRYASGRDQMWDTDGALSVHVSGMIAVTRQGGSAETASIRVALQSTR